MNSIRRYKAVYHLNGNVLHTTEFSLFEVFSELSNRVCPEIFYALDEIMDDVLDLKIAESIFFQPNRDLNTSKAILVRIS